MENYQKVRGIPLLGIEELFGTSNAIIGDSKRPLILRTNGKVKVQYGNKFVDLFSFGKLTGVKIFETVVTKDKIDLNQNQLVFVEDEEAFYLVHNKELHVIISKDGEFLSFKNNQKLVPSEINTVQKNIGIVLDTEDDLISKIENKELLNGFVFIRELNNLYTIIDGEYREISLSKLGGELLGELSTKFDILLFSNLKFQDTKLNNNSLESLLKEYTIKVGNTIITIGQEYINFNKPFEINDIKSKNYSRESAGFRLYTEFGKSILEIDTLKVRDPLETDLDNSELIEPIIWITDYDIIFEHIVETETIGDDDIVHNYITLESEESLTDIIDAKYKINDILNIRQTIKTFEDYLDIFIVDNEDGELLEQLEETLIFPMFISTEVKITNIKLNEDSSGILYEIESLDSEKLLNHLNNNKFFLLSGNNIMRLYKDNLSSNLSLNGNGEINTKIGNLTELNIENIVDVVGFFSRNAYIFGGYLKSKSGLLEINLENDTLKAPIITTILSDINKINEEIILIQNNIKDLTENLQLANNKIISLEEKLVESDLKINNLGVTLLDYIETDNTRHNEILNQLKDINTRLDVLEEQP